MVSAEIKKEMLALVDTKAFYEAVCVTAEVDRKTISRKQVNEYLRRWVDAKTWMFELFGHKLELVQEIEIPADRDTVRENISDLCKKYPQYAATISHLRTSDFADGVITNANDAFLKQVFPQVYRKGAKTSRVLSKILNDAQFDIELSKILQNNMIKGRAVVSINPLDFVTLSTNTHKWGSCMSILYEYGDKTSNKGGFNKVGGFSLMLDDCSMIAFLDHNKSSVYSNDFGSFTWNDKVFRQLLTIDKKDLDNVVYGHYNGTPSDVVKQIWGDMLCSVMGGKDWKMETLGYYDGNTHGGNFYYDIGTYNYYGSSKPNRRKIGVKELWCVCCGKKFSGLHSHENWLSCKNKCVEKKENKK